MKIFFIIFIPLLFLTVGCAGRQLTSEEQIYLNNISENHSPKLFRDGEETRIAWGRAQGWVAMYSSLKIQTVTDYVIETYNPSGNYPIQFGYSIVKIPVNGGCNIGIRCFSNNPYVHKLEERNARILSYYLKTGEMLPQLISK